MPLHAQSEALGRLHAHGLDGPVLGHRLHQKARRQSVDALRVQRVDLDPGGAAQKRLQPAARGDLQRMSEPITLGPGLGLVGAVVAAAWQLVHMLVQAAAQRHVELLDAPANG